MWWSIGILVVAVITISLLAYFKAGCRKGGRCDWRILGRKHGEFDISLRSGGSFIVDGYLELTECSKCEDRKGWRWTDLRSRRYGGYQEVDVTYVENYLREEVK